ncbi:hypothetical protein [Labedaea rhizosphaerae]|uniref:Acyl carrier protein n=1 Tax=Labedaea rhizosphaerae TaxID=598644 RepID=A0A4R6S1Y5_LABRH|nr:hypothetical protein [Labedaea rhizosphaerae]TDP93007.1 hypothetical protein EV186_107242 [Labedaea rhizosphaerae]
MNRGELPSREDVLRLLAGLDGRTRDDVEERIESMELAWLVHQVEQHYGVRVELDEEHFGRMMTVTGAVEVIREVIGAAR